ncbi:MULTISPECIES: hypothetical protein [Myxococcus]|uniref:DUF1501 domain-containing protein n=1 Tax=Myxococcus xanthus TaxID=34 RepID=A0AAE6G0V3_MYXXA|nr:MULTISPECIES: hypothetical protein [Myxococcus]QDE68655.1 hypothetical protein BHS09_17630 [Myxococcus xanthus]QDE75932.1 hypothetical protein BHS08_17645 [Myxococcus xanthus]QDE83366.1 hypothetical protein BHS07_18360 [Myxococcus xanthus]QDE97495.1 hypothetical protein BHS05_17510 [Myxococcus xanthus]QDF05133.1 hypothetical protein BHS04_18265 [Myxococcus xanthus]
MSLRKDGRLSRRELVRAMSLCAAGSTVLGPLLTGCREALDTPDSLGQRGGARRARLDGKPRFLIVVGAAGGASIIDSFLAVRASEAGPDAARLNTFADGQVQSVLDSPFRAVQVSSPRLGNIPVPVRTDQLPFVTKHKASMLVATSVGTSVNHVIAQKRSLTGNSAWRGRTLQECVALQYGAGFPIPNVNMGMGGYAERGTDTSLPAHCYGEVVTNASLWPLGLDGRKGLKDVPPEDVVALARQTRNALDARSVFGQTFENAPALRRWNEQRIVGQPALEMKDLINRLSVLPDAPPRIPLSEFGLSSSPDGARLRAAFPDYFTDPVEGQAALAFLLLKYRVSVTVTLGPSFNVAVGGETGIANPPLAFDFSHNDHRTGQAFMWARVLGVVDRLIGLLKEEPFDEASGESLWDRTLIYVATEFGRTRPRALNATEFGTGHDLNNGFLMLSPMLRGNTVLGGIDSRTTLTYGFDPRTGAPAQGKLASNEADIFSGILTAMGVDTSGSGLPDASGFLPT